jgi:carboxymethylenebutenolidase
MEPTRRQFLQTALAGAAIVAAGKEAYALTQEDSAASSASPSSGAGAWKTVAVSDKSQMKLYVSRPKAQKVKVPGVIVLQEIFGVNAHIRSVTDRIAGLGYVAAAPDLFHRTASGFESGYEDTKPGIEQMQKMTDDGLTADLKAAYEWLTQDAQVDASHIGSVGYCMGGRASFLANAVLPLQAAASYYGGGIADTLLPRARDQHAPVILFTGGKDTHITRDKRNAVTAALKDAGKPYVDIEFSEAEHGFNCDMRASYNPEASREAWAIFSEFFKIHLGA